MIPYQRSVSPGANQLQRRERASPDRCPGVQESQGADVGCGEGQGWGDIPTPLSPATPPFQDSVSKAEQRGSSGAGQTSPHLLAASQSLILQTQKMGLEYLPQPLHAGGLYLVCFGSGVTLGCAQASLLPVVRGPYGKLRIELPAMQVPGLLRHLSACLKHGFDPLHHMDS